MNIFQSNNGFDKFIHYLYYEYVNIQFNIGAWLRVVTGKSKRFGYLKSLHNKYQGQRCFLLATGPSLTLEDILMLKDEFTIGMNNICLLYEKTNWRPNILGVQDRWVYEKIEPVLKDNPNGVFVASYLEKYFPYCRNFIEFPLNFFYHQYDFRYSNKLSAKFCDNSFKVVYDAYSITFSLMQLAVYMGFKEIYLLGCDCNQAVGKNNHFIESGHVESDEKLATSADRNIYGHTKIETFCVSHGVKVYNATRGGNLEVYPRVSLDELLCPK